MTYFGNLTYKFLNFSYKNYSTVSTLKEQKATLITVMLSTENKNMLQLLLKNSYNTFVENVKD